MLAGYLAYERWWPAGQGTIVVISDPPGAQVWMDLKSTSGTTNGAVRATRGRHSVTVRKDTLESDPVAQIVDVQSGKTDTVFFRLIPPDTRALEKVVPRKETALPPKTTPEMSVLPPEPAKEETRPIVSVETTRTLIPPKLESLTPRENEGIKTGALEISSTLLGARVFINDEMRPEVTPATLYLTPGTYTVRIEHAGYTSEPKDQTVRLVRSSTPQFVFFTLTESRTALREIAIETTPVAGQIFVDSVSVGEGKAVASREFGIYIVTFGDVEGWRTPEPVRATLTPTKPRLEIKGTYTRIFRVSALAEGENSVKTEGEIRWETGAYFEGRGAERSASLGPRIKDIPGSQKFGWELAAGDINRNPTGGDYVEFIFTLPPDVPPDSPLGLRLYLYRSARRYALTTSNRSELVVSVNGRTFLDGYRPVHAVTSADLDRYEEWSLQGVLKAGENRVMIRTNDDNTLFHYLWKFEIR